MAYIGKQPVVGNFVKLDAIVTSATTTFNLLNGGVAYFPQSANNCIVSLNGIIQEPTSSGNVGGYTISGSTIVFTSALTTLDVIDFILVLGDTLSIGTPSDGTVSFAKVTSNLITGATAETSIAGGDSVLIYDDSASALRKMTRTNFVAGVGGTNTPAFKATMSANQSTSASFTKVNFNTEIYDTDNCYDSTTNYRFTPTTAGKYYITTGMSLTPNVTGSIIPAIYFNGSEVARGNAYAGNSTSRAEVSTSITFNGSTDYVEIYIYQSTGTNDINKDYAFFQAFRLIGV
jgi:hypothetical protein